MGRIYDAVIEFLKDDSWRYEEISGEPAVRFGFTGRNARFECFGRANEEHGISEILSWIWMMVKFAIKQVLMSRAANFPAEWLRPS